MAKNIYDVVEAHRSALIAKEYQTVKNILRAYEAAELSVERAIRAYQAKVAKAQASGLQVSPAWVFQEARLENILREMRMEMDTFSKDALEFTMKGRADAYELGAVHALRLGEASVVGDFSGFHRGAFWDLQGQLTNGSPVKVLFDEIGPTATEKAREAFARGVALGQNPRDVGRALKKQIDGLSVERAEVIARTEMIRAYRTANNDVFKRNTDVLRGWRWTCAKTPATCALCLGLDGEIFDTEEVMKSHPACRCTMVPLPATDFGGPQPKSGAEYFDNLDEADQRRILGPGKHKLYKEGKLTLRDNIDFKEHPEYGKQPRPRRIAEINKLHAEKRLPSQLGETLSGYTPPKAASLEDVLAIGRAPRKSADPIQSALDEWEASPKAKTKAKTTLPSVKSAAYKKAGPKSLKGIPNVIEEVEIAKLTATNPYVSDEKVKGYIRELGDGPDLPKIVSAGGKLYVHDGDSLARIEAKKLLGQTKASVRLYTYIGTLGTIADTVRELYRRLGGRIE